MKLRVSPKKGRPLTVELESEEDALPPIPLPELQVKRILVPTDFSPPSRKAANYAASLAKQFGAEILMLHVVEPVTPPPSLALVMTEDLDRHMREEAARRLADWRKEIGVTTMKANVRTGAPYHEIIAAAEETNTDLIVIGTHGHRKLAQIFLGSTAERVVRHARCPVLVVREREHDFLVGTEAATETTNLKGE